MPNIDYHSAEQTLGKVTTNIIQEICYTVRIRALQTFSAIPTLTKLCQLWTDSMMLCLLQASRLETYLLRVPNNIHRNSTSSKNHRILLLMLALAAGNKTLKTAVISMQPEH